jgi:hypothetical protein
MAPGKGAGQGMRSLKAQALFRFNGLLPRPGTGIMHQIGPGSKWFSEEFHPEFGGVSGKRKRATAPLGSRPNSVRQEVSFATPCASEP